MSNSLKDPTLLQESYREVSKITLRMKCRGEDFTLPEKGPASEKEINEAENKTYGISDCGIRKPFINNLRGICKELREEQALLDSLEQ